MTLRFLPSSTAQCARVYATGEVTGTQRPSNAVPRQARDLSIGVAQSAELGDSVTLEAHGYDSADCTGPWTDDSNVVQRAFVKGTVPSDPVLLVLDGRPVTNSDGGVELCDNGSDDDADQLADCKDPDCDSRSCGAPRFCVGGQCVTAMGEVDCRNGLDDDLNGKADCLDPACDAKACNGTDPCKTSPRCMSLACGGDAVVCNSPGPCQLPGGTCGADGGCSYLPKSATTCGDAGMCTPSGVCGFSFPFPTTNIPRDLPEAQVGDTLTLDCGDTTYNTDTNTWSNLCSGQVAPPTFLVNQPSGGPVLRVLGVRSLTITGGDTLILEGTLPLAIAVLGNATIGGRIEANAQNEVNGAGSPGTSCGASAGTNGVVGSQAGGGGAGHGGAGQRGGSQQGVANSGGMGGVATTDTDLSPLRGGCNGGPGGIPSGTVAEGGGGGGALQLSVAGTLALSGRLLANGAGGSGGTGVRAGGGGGGSGGGILLEATTLTLTGNARVLAMGGGGGGGADNNTDGDDGEDGHTNDSDAALGGPASGNAGSGGDAQDPGNAAAAGSSAQDSQSAGGGGGGGMGRIVVHGTCTRTSNVVIGPDVGAACTNI